MEIYPRPVDLWGEPPLVDDFAYWIAPLSERESSRSAARVADSGGSVQTPRQECFFSVGIEEPVELVGRGVEHAVPTSLGGRTSQVVVPVGLCRHLSGRAEESQPASSLWKSPLSRVSPEK